MCISDENRSSPMRKPMTLMYKHLPYDIRNDGSIQITNDRHDITEILLKVALNTIKQTNNMKPHENHLKHTVL